MVDQDQVRPLAPSADRTTGSDGEEPPLQHNKNTRRKRCLKCCGCATAVLLLLATTIVVLIFTVFRIKDPVIQLNGVTVAQLELINNTIPKPGTNASVIADVSVKNPNVASFRYDNTTSQLYYHGELVGEARGPPGKARARRTLRMNVTVDIVTDKLIGSPELRAEIGSGLLTIGSYSKIPGRVKVLGIVRKHITVKMNCSLTVNITTQDIVSQKCKKKVDL